MRCSCFIHVGRLVSLELTLYFGEKTSPSTDQLILNTMELIGTSASLIALIDTALKTFKCIKSLVDGYKNAPAEIRDLGHRLDGLDSNLRLLRYVQVTVVKDENALRFDSTDFDVLQRSLMVTSVIFLEIRTFLTSITRKDGRTARLKWAIHDAKKVKSWEDRLQLHGDILQRTLLLLNTSECLHSA
jgi:hypothetical protein